MRLELIRDTFHEHETLGQLFIDGVLECQTLEDKVREVEGQPVGSWKIHGETAIPRGGYPVRMTLSNRFKKVLPILLGVPGYDGVRIHSGNTQEDTSGCILVGVSRGANSVNDSRDASRSLNRKIQAAIDAGERVSLEVS